MAQDQILVNASSLPSSAGVPASAAGNGIEEDSNSNSSPDSGVNDDFCSSEAASEASGSSGSSRLVGLTATVVSAREDRHNGYSPPSESEQQQLQQQRSQPAVPQSSPQQQPQPPHVVHVHVHPGETFRVRMGNQIQQIKGPATVRMVSSTGPPPLPMPLQQPPGHVIQQLMDENGVLTHVILSPQPPNMGHAGGAVPMPYSYGNWETDMQPQHPMQPYPWNGGGQGMQPFYPPAHFASAPGQYGPAYHHHPMTGAPAQAQPPRLAITSGNNSAAGGQLAPHDANGVTHRNETAAAQAYSNVAAPVAAMAAPLVPACMAEMAAAPLVSGLVGERQQAQLHGMLAYLPVINIVSIEARTATIHIAPPGPPLVPTQQEQGPQQLAANEVDASALPAAEAAASESVTSLPGSSTNSLGPSTGSLDAAASSSDAASSLSYTAGSHPDSTFSPPDSAAGHVYAAGDPVAAGLVAACQVVTATGPADSVSGPVGLVASSPDSATSSPDFVYDVLISESKRDGAYKIFYSGEATEILLQDLKPATDYSVKVGASLAGIRWPETEPFMFRTNCSVPDPPQAPTMVSRARSNIMLRWQSALENGSKITLYSLEMDQGNGKFTEVYCGSQRSQKVTKLAPSTGYYFRLAAVNGVGKSEFSEVVQYFTSGSLPEIPDRPQLVRATSDLLSITWSLPATTATHANSGDDPVTFSLQMEEEMTQHGFRAVYNGHEPKYTIDRLRRNTEYKFRVCAANEEGPSKWSPIATFRTLPDSPGAPGRPQTKGKVHPTSFRLTWDPPRDTGGSSIESYVAQLDYGADFEEVYCGSSCECTCTELHPGFTYRARVASRSGAGLQGPWSELTVVTTPPVTPAACPAPRLHGKAKAHSIEIRWSSPDYDGGANVTEYKVQLLSGKPAIGDSSHICEPGTVSREVYHGPALPGNMSCTIAGLLPGQQYLVQVRAINKAGEGPWSEPLSVTSGTAPPAQPAPPQCLVRTPHSIAVNWCEPMCNGSPIHEYRLHYSMGNDSNDNQTSIFSQVYAGPALTYEVKGLLPATCYAFKVEALNSAGASEGSLAANCTTSPSVPGPVTGISVVHVRATAVQLQWQAPASHGSAISSYEIDCSNRVLFVGGSSTECCIDDLQPLTTYKFRVRASNGIGSGPYSAQTLKVTTNPLPPPAPELEMVAVTSNSVKLKWTSVSTAPSSHSARSSKQGPAAAAIADGNGVSYTLLMLRDGKSAIVLYSGVALTHKVGKLMDNTTYQFQVYASNSAGDGTPSEVLAILTQKAQPPALKAPTASHVMPSSVRLAWPACQLRSTTDDNIVYVVQLLKVCSTVDGTISNYEERYRGSELTCRLTDLEPATSYQARVAPLRVCRDDGSVVSGAFSQCTEFVTSNVVPTAEGPSSADRVAGARGPVALVEKLKHVLWMLLLWPTEHAEVSLVGLFVMLCLVITAVVIWFLGH